MPTVILTPENREVMTLLRQVDHQLAQLIEALRGAPPLRALEIQRAIDRVLERLDGATQRWVEATLPRQYVRASDRATKELLAVLAGAQVVRRLTDLDRTAIRALQQATRENFSGLARGITQAVDSIILSGGNADAIRRFFEESSGRTLVRVAGKNWKTSAYADVIFNFRSAQTQREGFKNRFLNNNVSLVRISSNGSQHPKCAKHEGRVYSLTGSPAFVNGEEYPPLEVTKESGGLFHAHCVHTMEPIVR